MQSFDQANPSPWADQAAAQAAAEVTRQTTVAPAWQQEQDELADAAEAQEISQADAEAALQQSDTDLAHGTDTSIAQAAHDELATDATALSAAALSDAVFATLPDLLAPPPAAPAASSGGGGGGGSGGSGAGASPAPFSFYTSYGVSDRFSTDTGIPFKGADEGSSDNSTKNWTPFPFEAAYGPYFDNAWTFFGGINNLSASGWFYGNSNSAGFGLAAGAVGFAAAGSADLSGQLGAGMAGTMFAAATSELGQLEAELRPADPDPAGTAMSSILPASASTTTTTGGGSTSGTGSSSAPQGFALSPSGAFAAPSQAAGSGGGTNSGTGSGSGNASGSGTGSATTEPTDVSPADSSESEGELLVFEVNFAEPPQPQTAPTQKFDPTTVDDPAMRALITLHPSPQQSAETRLLLPMSERSLALAAVGAADNAAQPLLQTNLEIVSNPDLARNSSLQLLVTNFGLSQPRSLRPLTAVSEGEKNSSGASDASGESDAFQSLDLTLDVAPAESETTIVSSASPDFNLIAALDRATITEEQALRIQPPAYSWMSKEGQQVMRDTEATAYTPTGWNIIDVPFTFVANVLMTPSRVVIRVAEGVNFYADTGIEVFTTPAEREQILPAWQAGGEPLGEVLLERARDEQNPNPGYGDLAWLAVKERVIPINPLADDLWGFDRVTDTPIEGFDRVERLLVHGSQMAGVAAGTLQIAGRTLIVTGVLPPGATPFNLVRTPPIPAARYAALRNALTDANGVRLTAAERDGILFTIKRVEREGYRVVGAVKFRGNQGIDVEFVGVWSNAGRIALAEGKAGSGLGLLELDAGGIRQASLEFFISRATRAGRLDIVQALRNGTADGFAGFAASGKLFKIDFTIFVDDIDFVRQPGAATLVPP